MINIRKRMSENLEDCYNCMAILDRPLDLFDAAWRKKCTIYGFLYTKTSGPQRFTYPRNLEYYVCYLGTVRKCLVFSNKLIANVLEILYL